jgi:hypothetical protein
MGKKKPNQIKISEAQKRRWAAKKALEKMTPAERLQAVQGEIVLAVVNAINKYNVKGLAPLEFHGELQGVIQHRGQPETGILFGTVIGDPQIFEERKRRIHESQNKTRS